MSVEKKTDLQECLFCIRERYTMSVFSKNSVEYTKRTFDTVKCKRWQGNVSASVFLPDLDKTTVSFKGKVGKEQRRNTEGFSYFSSLTGRIFISVNLSEYCQPVQEDHSIPSA